jgi:hypothetical protein
MGALIVLMRGVRAVPKRACGTNSAPKDRMLGR